MAPDLGGTRLGLRVDVDTYRGTRDGVPRLLEVLGARGLRASFFFTLGPDNMGRHLWRLARPAFLRKMLRSRAASLYGWDVLLRGTLWPGPPIGERLGDVIRRTADAGHEVGFHAWDHHAWQTKLERMEPAAIRESLERGVGRLSELLGRAPSCSAAAGWKCDERVLIEKERFGFRYNSDCRGRSIFRPALPEGPGTPQVPVTLPTYDELVGTGGVEDASYNERLLALVRPGALEVLTIHAEVEGIARAGLFERFLALAGGRGLALAPLGELLPPLEAIPAGRIRRGEIPGREGWVALEADAA